MTFEGRRLPNEVPPQVYEPGDYGRFRGAWMARTPHGDLCPLRDVFEHDTRRLSGMAPGWLLIEGKWES